MTTTIKNIKKSLEKKHFKNTKDFLKKKKKKRVSIILNEIKTFLKNKSKTS